MAAGAPVAITEHATAEPLASLRVEGVDFFSFFHCTRLKISVFLGSRSAEYGRLKIHFILPNFVPTPNADVLEASLSI